MQSEVASPAAGPRLQDPTSWYDSEVAGVVTILLGLFQILLSVPLYYAEAPLPKFFVLPLLLGIVILAGGSFTMANERNPSRYLLQGSACSNVVGLLGALIAFCLYCYCLTKVKYDEASCLPSPTEVYYGFDRSCPAEHYAATCWSLILLLLLIDSVAVLLHFLQTAFALHALKTD